MAAGKGEELQPPLLVPCNSQEEKKMSWKHALSTVVIVLVVLWVVNNVPTIGNIVGQ
jgi:sRNA-binding regulator protein Hfq